MNGLVKTGLAGTMVVLVAACQTWDAQEILAQASRGDAAAFDQALAGHYTAFAVTETADYDWIDAGHFAGKGAAAAQGKTPAPEDPASWRLPAAFAPAIDQKRAHLMLLLDNGWRDVDPKSAAEAQFLFDCWVEQQEENWQPRDIAACRKPLETVLASALVEWPALAQRRHVVRFDSDSVALDETAKAELRRVLADVADLGRVELAVIGHTDQNGSNAYNYRLGSVRAWTVANYLVSNGIDASHIAVKSRGENRPIADAAGAASPAANRRVEIRVAATATAETQAEDRASGTRDAGQTQIAGQ
jgi:OOP family OmpA-OmpF porin